MLKEAVLAAIMSLPGKYYVAGSEPETRDEYEARMGVIASAVAMASKEITCSLPDQTECKRSWPGSAEEMAAMLVSMAWWESRFALNVHEGKCGESECDSLRLRNGSVVHRSRSLWQLQESSIVPHDVWLSLGGTDQDETDVAASYAARVIASHRLRCAGRVKGWEIPTIAGYVTGNCEWKQSEARAKTYHKVMAKILRAKREQHGS